MQKLPQYASMMIDSFAVQKSYFIFNLHNHRVAEKSAFNGESNENTN